MLQREWNTQFSTSSEVPRSSPKEELLFLATPETFLPAITPFDVQAQLGDPPLSGPSE